MEREAVMERDVGGRVDGWKQWGGGYCMRVYVCVTIYIHIYSHSLFIYSSNSSPVYLYLFLLINTPFLHLFSPPTSKSNFLKNLL